MIKKEFRIVLPLTTEEYRVGQLYSVAKSCQLETKGDSGVEVLKNEEYDNESGKGQYTSKVYHLGSRLPGWIAALAPAEALKLEEEAWNAFPDCKTQLAVRVLVLDHWAGGIEIDRVGEQLPVMGDRFTFRIESKHFDNDRGERENVFELPDGDLKSLEVEKIDITNKALISADDYKEELDPALVGSEKTGRGPLAANWESTCEPVMCAYKLVTVEFRWWGLQTRIQSYIMGMETAIFAKFHRQLFCWLDEWHGMSMEDVREMEDRVAQELAAALADAPTKGSNVKAIEGGDKPEAEPSTPTTEKKGWFW